MYVGGGGWGQIIISCFIYSNRGSWVLLSVCPILGQFSQLSVMQYMGLCVFSLPIYLMMIVRIRVLYLIIIMKTYVWCNSHCLGSGHEKWYALPRSCFMEKPQYIMNIVAVAENENSCCRFNNDRAIVSAGSGYLANSITLDTGCGSVDCPWHLQASEGQRINLSIYDFGLCKYLIELYITGHVISRLYASKFIANRPKSCRMNCGEIICLT